MTVQEALLQLVPEMQNIYGASLKAIVLYGSVARGTDTPESDVDIALLLLPGTDREQFDRMIRCVAGLELACDRVLSVTPVDAERFREWEDVLPYYRNIRKEGIVLWQAA